MTREHIIVSSLFAVLLIFFCTKESQALKCYFCTNCNEVNNETLTCTFREFTNQTKDDNPVSLFNHNEMIENNWLQRDDNYEQQCAKFVEKNGTTHRMCAMWKTELTKDEFCENMQKVSEGVKCYFCNDKDMCNIAENTTVKFTVLVISILLLVCLK